MQACRKDTNPWAFNAGDRGTPTGQKYEYDEENRLTRVRRLTNPPDEILLEIRYDALGRRVESKEYLDAQTGQMLATPRVTHHVVLGPMTIEEYSITAGPTATLVREFVWGVEYPLPVAMINRTGSQTQVLQYHRDVLGNVVALTDADGNVVERYRYEPYGVTHIYNASGALLTTSAYGNPYAYTGQRHDAAVALYHFWFRTYSPSLGRWHQRDPMGYVDGSNMYEYVRSHSIQRTDPTGLQAAEVVVGGGILLGGGGGGGAAGGGAVIAGGGAVAGPIIVVGSGVVIVGGFAYLVYEAYREYPWAFTLRRLVPAAPAIPLYPDDIMDPSDWLRRYPDIPPLGEGRPEPYEISDPIEIDPTIPGAWDMPKEEPPPKPKSDDPADWWKPPGWRPDGSDLGGFFDGGPVEECSAEEPNNGD